MPVSFWFGVRSFPVAVIEDQDHDQHDLRKSLFWLSVVSKVRVHCGKGRHSSRWQEQEAGRSLVYTQETGERVHTGSKAAPPKGSTASLNSATNWEPSVQMPEIAEGIFIQTTTLDDLGWHCRLTVTGALSLGVGRSAEGSFFSSPLCSLPFSFWWKEIRWLSYFSLASKHSVNTCSVTFPTGNS